MTVELAVEGLMLSTVCGVEWRLPTSKLTSIPAGGDICPAIRLVMSSSSRLTAEDHNKIDSWILVARESVQL